MTRLSGSVVLFHFNSMAHLLMYPFTSTTSTVKKFKQGCHRVVPPEVTIDRIRPHLARFGITRLANVTGLDIVGIPVALAVRPNSRSLSVAQGKGITLAAAKASALMESVECFHAERISRPLRLASYRELQRDVNVVEVARLARPSNSRFHRDLPLLWIEGIDLLTGTSIWVPLQVVSTAYTSEMSFDFGSFYSSTTGLASGNCQVEAINHGLCEVIERDALARLSKLGASEVNARRIDLATIDDVDCRKLLSKLEEAGVRTALWEATATVRIASFECLIEDADNEGRPVEFRGCISGGGGCHPARAVAAARAIAEAAQSRLTAISGSRDDLLRKRFQASRSHLLPKDFWSQNGSRNFCDVPNYDSMTVEGDQEWIITQLKGGGFDVVIVVDLSLQEFKIPVVRIVIPGMNPSLGDIESIAYIGETLTN